MEPTFKHQHYSTIPAEEFGETAPGVTIRKLISDEIDGAPFYNLRMLEIAPGGNTPDHSHDNEHENFVLRGAGEVMFEGERHKVGPGDVIFVPAGARHQYRNLGDEPFVFLCGVPTARLLGS
jgi:quercetin dioxygenase-like cupin family protein